MTDPQGPREPPTPEHPQAPPDPPAPPHGRQPVAAGPGAGAPGRGLWDGATSTTGGRVAVAAAALLGVVLLVSVLGLGALVVGRAVLRDDRGHMMSEDRGGAGEGMRDGPGNGRGGGRWNDRDAEPGTPLGPGPGAPGRRAPRQRAPGLGAALHGELTTADADGQPVTRVFQVGEVTAYTEGTSLAVKSTDGFTATYTITADTVTRAAAPAVGAIVRVVALQEGLAVTRLTVVGQPRG